MLFKDWWQPWNNKSLSEGQKIEIHQINKNLVESYFVQSITIKELRSGEAVLCITQNGSYYVIRADSNVYKQNIDDFIFNNRNLVFTIKEDMPISVGQSLYGEKDENTSEVTKIRLIPDPNIVITGGEIAHFTPYLDLSIIKTRPVQIITANSVYQFKKN